MENNRPEYIHGKSLNAMSTENLQELLRGEMESDGELDVALIKNILAVLDERITQEDVDVDAAWDRFIHNHLPSEPIISMPEDTPTRKKSSRKKHYIHIGLIAALIAVFCLGVGVTASAAGYDILDAVMQWSSETFGFCYGQSSDTSSIESNPEYAELREAVETAGISVPLVPCYLPDGYKQTEFHSDTGRYIAMFENGDNTIYIRIQEIRTSNSTQLEKDQLSPDVYTVNGIDHYITTNMDEYLATWTNNGYECFISCVQSRTELIKMIDSIYTEESA